MNRLLGVSMAGPRSSAPKRGAVALALAAVIAGCGGGQSSSAQVVNTSNAYFRSLGSGKLAKACSYLTSSLRGRLERAGTRGVPCDGMLTKLTPPRAGVSSFQIHGDSASLTALGRGGRTATIVLTNTAGEWKISDIRPSR